jgi:hypothetical protein
MGELLDVNNGTGPSSSTERGEFLSDIEDLLAAKKDPVSRTYRLDVDSCSVL